MVAIASGKGGTGKTTIATNLAYLWAGSGQRVQYVDCDVEEPNGQVFLKPLITERLEVAVAVPRVDTERCAGCGKCGRICQYGAIVCIRGRVMTFEELCHSCGGCRLICPVGAIGAKDLWIGEIEIGRAGRIDFAGGTLRIGSARTPALIRRVKRHVSEDGLVIIDVPPGTSCPVVESLKGVDFVLLVTEPTPFGLHDLKLAVELVREMRLPFAVAINRYGIGDNGVERYCSYEDIDVILKVPEDRRVAEVYSSGALAADVLDGYGARLAKVLKHIRAVVGQVWNCTR